MRITPKKNTCCGCHSCELSCPKSAIRLDADEEGFYYPLIDDNKCIDCGICEKTCPVINANRLICTSKLAFAAVDTDMISERESSSGGMFSVIANHIIDKGGVVFGAAFDSDLQLKHIPVCTKNDLIKLKGSKYLSSNLSNCYRSVKEYLGSGRLVCFSGTPCQVAGLKLFLVRDYPNLITIDLICHGVPSQKMFSSFIEDIQTRRHIKLTGFLFRDKNINGWACCSPSCFSEKKYIAYDKAMSVYMSLFLNGELMREMCYSCPFAQNGRVSDFTLGDFWNILDVYPDFVKGKGVSALILNTEKALSIFEKIKNKIYFKECSFQDIASGNYNLNHPTIRPANRDLFLDRLNDIPKTINENLPESYRIDKAKYILKRILRKFRLYNK